MILGSCRRTVLDQSPELLTKLFSEYGIGRNGIEVGRKKLEEIAMTRLFFYQHRLGARFVRRAHPIDGAVRRLDRLGHD